MRNAFVKTLFTEARKNHQIFLLTGDLGFSVFEDFAKEFPRRYLNCGVAEQNMAGVAAGLAHVGYLPIIYSIVPFVTMRCFEQIRNDILYPNLNVKIVGVGVGFSYGTYGYSHYGLEDIGVMRTLPGMTILSPADPVETVLATKAMITHTGPVYLRLGKAGEPVLHHKIPRFEISKMIRMQNGGDGTIFATSNMVETALAVANKLTSRNTHLSVFSVPTLVPIDKKTIRLASKNKGRIITIEESMVSGGLGSIVSEVISDLGIGVAVMRCGVTKLPDRVGQQAFMRKLSGLDVNSLVSSISRFVRSQSVGKK